jgi:hypothetical protein
MLESFNKPLCKFEAPESSRRVRPISVPRLPNFLSRQNPAEPLERKSSQHNKTH